MSHEIPTLEGATRERTGTRYAARLRAEGKIPAVVYGHKIDPVHITVDETDLLDILHSHAHLINVAHAGQTESCLLKAVQYNHLGNEIVHVDFARVDLSEEVEVELELEFKGEPKALEASGIVLDHQLTSLTVKCRADAIPDSITVDISALTLDTPVTVADIKLPAGVVAVGDAETLVAQLTEVQEQEEVETDVDESAGPEVISERKAKDDDAESDS